MISSFFTDKTGKNLKLLIHWVWEDWRKQFSPMLLVGMQIGIVIVEGTSAISVNQNQKCIYFWSTVSPQQIHLPDILTCIFMCIHNSIRAKEDTKNKRYVFQIRPKCQQYVEKYFENAPYKQKKIYNLNNLNNDYMICVLTIQLGRQITLSVKQRLWMYTEILHSVQRIQLIKHTFNK